MTFEQSLVNEIFNAPDTEAAVVDTAPGSSKPIRGKFFSQYEIAKLNNIEASSCQPEWHCATADLAGVLVGAKIAIRGTDYYAKAFHPDGTGITILPLKLDK
jgi:hypothetical protein